MKVLLIIDHFGAGGAQRQMVELACGLQRRGHGVEMFVYFPRYDFFRARLDEQRIPVHGHDKQRSGSGRVVTALARVLRAGRFDVAVAFLSTANVYAELARLAAPRTHLIISERTSYHDDKSAAGSLLRRLLHVLADRVVANSETQAAWLRGRPWLRHKVSCIYNGVDLEGFRAAVPQAPQPHSLKLLGIGRVGPEKNILTLIRALARFGVQCGYVPEVAWAGPRDESAAGQRYCAEVDALLASAPQVQRRWHWLGLRRDVPQLLREYHALVHPSLYEGAPNAVCEALAAARPVLASDVCDHPLLVADGVRGFLFDPRAPESLVQALKRLTQLDAEAWQTLGRNARAYAESELGIERMVGRYEALCEGLLAGRSAGQIASR